MLCFNRNVLIALGVVALGVLVVAPDAFVAALPVLVLLACPLSMVVMMWAMSRGNREAARTNRDEAPEPQVQDATAPEVVRLRAEVDQLRAELADKRRSEPSIQTPGDQTSR
jgi:hypothetical protein